MSLSKDLQQKLHGYLLEKILGKIDKYNLIDEDSSKPFQYALFTRKGYLAKPIFPRWNPMPAKHTI